jgi:hypothetical protein
MARSALMEEAADLIPIIDRWMRIDDGVEVPARSVEEAAGILPYAALPVAQPVPGRC